MTLAGACALGITTTALSTALNFGPDHAMSWLAPPVVPGLLMGLVLGCALAFLHRRVVAALGLVLLTTLIALVNQTGADPYFALSLGARPLHPLPRSGPVDRLGVAAGGFDIPDDPGHRSPPAAPPGCPTDVVVASLTPTIPP